MLPAPQGALALPGGAHGHKSTCVLCVCRGTAWLRAFGGLFSRPATSCTSSAVISTCVAHKVSDTLVINIDGHSVRPHPSRAGSWRQKQADAVSEVEHTFQTTNGPDQLECGGANLVLRASCGTQNQVFRAPRFRPDISRAHNVDERNTNQDQSLGAGAAPCFRI